MINEPAPMNTNTRHPQPDPTETKAALETFGVTLLRIREERRASVPPAQAALARLITAMAAKSGQSYHLRALLYSAWNGQPADLSNLLCLDWDLRKDLLAVLLAFGWEERQGPPGSFYYDAIQKALTAANLFDWFTQQHNPTNPNL